MMQKDKLLKQSISILKGECGRKEFRKSWLIFAYIFTFGESLNWREHDPSVAEDVEKSISEKLELVWTFPLMDRHPASSIFPILGAWASNISASEGYNTSWYIREFFLRDF